MTCKKGKDNLYSIVFSTLAIVPRKLPAAELKITPFLKIKSSEQRHISTKDNQGKWKLFFPASGHSQCSQSIIHRLKGSSEIFFLKNKPQHHKSIPHQLNINKDNKANGFMIGFTSLLARVFQKVGTVPQYPQLFKIN